MPERVDREGMTPETKRFQHRMRREQMEAEGGVGERKSGRYGEQLGARRGHGQEEMNYPENAVQRRRRWRRMHKHWHEIVEEQERLRDRDIDRQIEEAGKAEAGVRRAMRVDQTE